jgi:hypothetical protein
MKYLFLAYNDEQQWEALTVNERNTFDEASSASDKALQESGYLLETADLQISNIATTVCVQRGKIFLADGSLGRINDPLVGIFFINAQDLNKAIQIATQMPQVQKGPIEIRPIMAVEWPLKANKLSN